DQLHPVAGGEDVGGMFGATDDPGVHLDRDLDPLGTQALEEPCHRQALIHFPRFSVELDLHSGLPSARSLARQRTCAGAFSPWRRLLKQPASPENGQAGMGAPPIRAGPPHHDPPQGQPLAGCADGHHFPPNARDVPGTRPRGRRNHMTRRIMFAACAMAAVAFTGCQDQRRNAADQQQADQYSQVQDGYTGQDTQPTQDLDCNTQDPMSGEATGGAATTEDPAYAGNQPQTGTDGAAMGGSGAATSQPGDVKEASEDKQTVAEQD